MKTRSKRKVEPEIIQIESESQCPSQFMNKVSDDSDSSISETSSYFNQQQNLNFMNLMPTDQKKKKRNMNHLKSIFYKENSSPNIIEEQMQRAPILHLLRPINKNEQIENSEQKSEESIEPVLLADSDQQQLEQIKQMSEPKKKPKLMQELQKALHIPASQYQIPELDKNFREERKKQNKKRDYLIDKKFKQFRVGKKKDKVSNQVFNAIQDFFA